MINACVVVNALTGRTEVEQKKSADVSSSELPPLLRSVTVKGIPPRRESEFSALAEQRLLEIGRRWKLEQTFQWFYKPSVSLASFWYNGAVSADRFFAIAVMINLFLLIDDLVFDDPNDSLLQECCNDVHVRDSPQNIRAFLRRVNSLLKKEANPSTVPIEGMVWELGEDLRRLSSPEFVETLANGMLAHHEVCIGTHANHIAGDFSYLQTLDSYTRARSQNFGGELLTMLVELSNDAILPDSIRKHPTVQGLSNAALVHSSFVNDLFSYPREAIEEDNPRNLLKVLMDSEGLSLAEASWRSVDLVNSNMGILLELETQLPEEWEVEPWGPSVHRYVEGLKAFMSGNIHFCASSDRYRHPESVFPELRPGAGAGPQ